MDSHTSNENPNFRANVIPELQVKKGEFTWEHNLKIKKGKVNFRKVYGLLKYPD